MMVLWESVSSWWRGGKANPGAAVRTIGKDEPGVPPDEALHRLVDGNKRFVLGTSIRPNQTLERARELSAGQTPFAVIVGCSDSRVPCVGCVWVGLGDLFIVRTAGQVSTYASWGSIEFALDVLHARLILVLGHTNCGAVSAACTVPDVPGHIVTLINAIRPASVKAAHMAGDLVGNAVRVNVAMQVMQLRNLEPVLSRKYNSGSIKIVGGIYDLATGRVDFLSDEFITQWGQ